MCVCTCSVYEKLVGHEGQQYGKEWPEKTSLLYNRSKLNVSAHKNTEKGLEPRHMMTEYWIGFTA